MSDNAEKIGWIRQFLNEHPALIVSILYVVASIVGMCYAWMFLAQFDINVFHYAALSDFLLASLKDPMTWVIVIISVFSLVADNASSRRVQRRGASRWLAWYASERYRFVNNFVLIVIIGTLMYIYADTEAEKVKAGDGELIQVRLADAAGSRNAILLGTTGQFLFLYDEKSERVTIHPFENVASISPVADE